MLKIGAFQKPMHADCGVTLVSKVGDQAKFLTWCTYKVGSVLPLQKVGVQIFSSP